MSRASISRHLRRLRARWRLHRMEWEGMHRPLRPPPGFERFHSEEFVFPGLESKKKRNFKDFALTARKAWRLYLHSHVYDPEMAEFERKLLDREDTIIRRQAKAFLDRSEANFKRNQEAVRHASERVGEVLHTKRPEAEAMVKDRVNVLREAVAEFAEGYSEGVEGQFNFFKDSEVEDDFPPHVVSENNKPVIYRNEKI